MRIRRHLLGVHLVFIVIVCWAITAKGATSIPAGTIVDTTWPLSGSPYRIEGDIVVARTGATVGYAKRIGSIEHVTVFASYLVRFRFSDQIDDLIEQARLETNPKKQKALWVKAQKRIIEDAVALPLCITKFAFARKTYVDLGYEMRSTLTLVTPIKETTDIRK